MRPPKYTSLPDRFWSKVDEPNENGCWLWNAATDNWGYGWMRVGEKSVKAHRLSISDIEGEIPSGMLSLHKCDVPSCVNPSHLYIGTRQDNMDDMIRRGRGKKGNYGVFGEINGQSKLTADEVREIRNLYASGKYLHRELGERFGVARRTIGSIITRQLWKHV